MHDQGYRQDPENGALSPPARPPARRGLFGAPVSATGEDRNSTVSAPGPIAGVIALAVVAVIGAVVANWRMVGGALGAAVVALAAVTVIGAGGWVGLALWTRWRDATSHHPTADGLIAVRGRQASELGARALMEFHVTRQAQAAHAPVPHSLSQSIRIQGGPTDGPGTRLSLPAAPSWGELLARGDLGTDDGRVMLGWGADGPLRGDLTSIGIGGLADAGKTWTAVSIAAQVALNGGRLVVCDPHSTDSESLAARLAPLEPAYLLPMAGDTETILARLRAADGILNARKNGDPDRTCIAVLVDEWSSLLRGQYRAELPPLLCGLAQEGRKFGLYVLALAQRWSGESASADVRNALGTVIVHRTRWDEARLLTGMGGDTPRDTLRLPAGGAVVIPPSGEPCRVTMPRMTPADVEAVAGRLITTAPLLRVVTG